MAKDYSNKNWKKAEILERLGPVNYSVKTADDNLNWKRHTDQFLPCNLDLNENQSVNNRPAVFKGENEVIEISKKQQDLVELNESIDLSHMEKCTVTQAYAVSPKINSAFVKETIPLRCSSRASELRIILNL